MRWTDLIILWLNLNGTWWGIQSDSSIWDGGQASYYSGDCNYTKTLKVDHWTDDIKKNYNQLPASENVCWRFVSRIGLNIWAMIVDCVKKACGTYLSSYFFRWNYNGKQFFHINNKVVSIRTILNRHI